MKTLAVAEVISEGGRSGVVETANRGFRLKLGAPSEENPDAVTPEHLFAAALSACFHSAVLATAERAHLHVIGSTVAARVGLADDANNESKLTVELRVSLPGVDEAKAERLLTHAQQTCPYVKAIRNNVRLDVRTD